MSTRDISNSLRTEAAAAGLAAPAQVEMIEGQARRQLVRGKPGTPFDRQPPGVEHLDLMAGRVSRDALLPKTKTNRFAALVAAEPGVAKENPLILQLAVGDYPDPGGRGIGQYSIPPVALACSSFIACRRLSGPSLVWLAFFLPGIRLVRRAGAPGRRASVRGRGRSSPGRSTDDVIPLLGRVS
jgi:hypothetical protein